MRSKPQSARTLVWALSISLAATFEITVVFSSSGYLDVSVHRVPYIWLCIHHMLTEVLSARFPHSDISGSQDMCSSPKLFAAYHVFHRLLVPRHPPYALFCMTNMSNSFESIPTGQVLCRKPAFLRRNLFWRWYLQSKCHWENLWFSKGFQCFDDTDIALSALVLGQFLFCLFSSDSNHYLFITITSDVLILDI